MENQTIQNEAPEKSPVLRPKRKHGLLLVLIAVLGLYIASALAGLVVPREAGLLTQQLAMDFLYYLPFLVLPAALVMRKKGSLAAMRPNPILPGDVFLIIPLAILGVVAVNYIVTLWAIPLQRLGLDVYATGTLPSAQNTRELALSVFVIAVLPGVCEEILFRGAVLPAFEGMGTKRAVFISAALFALLHGSIAGLPTQFMLGLIMGAVVVLTDSIYAGLIYHTVHNAALVLWQFVLDSQVRGAAEAEPGDILTSIGGSTGVVSLIFVIAQLGLWMVLILRIMRKRAIRRGLQTEAAQKVKPAASEIALLCAVIVAAGILYLMDYLLMKGGAA